VNIISKKNEIRIKQLMKYTFSTKKDTYIHYKNKKKVIIFLAADYGNLGDVAITYAQKKILKENYNEYEVIEFPISKTFSELKSLKKSINKEDIVTIVGGGNMGNMYDDIEYCRQLVIKQFPNNKIISFPQTIDYSKDQEGCNRQKKAFKIYNNHSNIKIFAREEMSYEILKKYLPENKIGLAPDVVLGIDNFKGSIGKRKGVTFCLRNDNEKKINNEDQKKIVDYIKGLYDIKFYDTHIPFNNMSMETKYSELNKIWKKFSESELVITDRLHGMIFCAITGTPCIAINNSNGKVQGVFNLWLKELDYIKCINNFNLLNVQKSLSDIDLNKRYVFNGNLKNILNDKIFLNNKI